MAGKLKYVRIIISLYFFLILTVSFINIPGLAFGWALNESTTFLQIVPSLLRSTLIPVTAIGFIFVLLLTLFFGRVYCSSICPLGIFQDIISRTSQSFRKRKIFRFSKPHNYLRYGIFILVILFLLAGSTFMLNLLDPYSNFGKIWSGLFRPIVIAVNDLLSGLFEKMGSYAISPIGLVSFNFLVLIYPLIFLTTVIILASNRGRLFCNTICPVGTFLAITSKFSFLKLAIDKNTCTQCGKCSTACKAECIDVKNTKVEFDRCVGCFNCIQVCPERGIGYKKVSISSLKFLQKKQSQNQDFNYRFKNDSKLRFITDKKITTLQIPNNRRDFIQKSMMLLFAAGLMSIKSKASALAGIIAFKKKHAVTPPGSYRSDNFLKHCTSCHLCVSSCPTQVLQPSLMQFGIEGIFQPFMDYDKSYCNYECVKCSEVCPTGAILPINPEQKKAIQIGKVVFLKNNCIVYTDEKSCGACSEHCPTKAVRMVSYKGALTIPETDVNICVGCGACEYACPAEPYKAIYVEGNLVHQAAFKYRDEKDNDKTPQEFPF
jgi:ferredoxin